MSTFNTVLSSYYTIRAFSTDTGTETGASPVVGGVEGKYLKDFSRKQ